MTIIRVDRWDSARLWTINGDFFGFPPTGVARYGVEVTAALGQLVADGHPLTRDLRLRVVSPRPPSAAIRFAGLEMAILPDLKPRLPQVWVQWQLPRHLTGGLLSFGNLAPLWVDRHIACIHDVQTLTVPESYSWGFRAMHRLILPRVGRSAARITTVSETSRRQLARHGIAEAGKITVAPNGADHAAVWPSSDVRQAWRGKRPFALGIGRNEGHKNTRLFAELAPQLDRLGVDLVLAGDFDRALVSLEGSRGLTNVHFLGRVRDDELAAALDGALCFLFPSRSEGFGLPAVESMTRGCPVVAASIPVLHEVCSDGALFADPDDVAAWAAAVARLVDDPGLRKRQSEKGRARAAAYTWRRTAEIYLELMAAADASTAADPRRPSQARLAS